MNEKEKELVVLSENSYNLCAGGQGGFSYIHQNKLWDTQNHKKAASRNAKKATKVLIDLAKHDYVWKSRHSAKIKAVHQSKKSNYINPFYGKKHSEKTRLKLQKSKNKGKQNSQYGTCWITNGVENKKIHKEDLDIWIAQGYYRGRIKV